MSKNHRQTDTSCSTIVHPLAEGDVAVAAAMRAAMPPKDTTNNDLTERRRQFDAMMAATPLPDGLRTEKATVGGVPGWWCRPVGAKPDTILLYLHGGGYAQGRAFSFRGLAGHLAHRSGASAFVPDYRLAPEHPFPAAFDDALDVYRALARDQPKRIVIAGDSAGGGLTLALLSALSSEHGLPQPRSAAVLSPLTDLPVSGESMSTRVDADPGPAIATSPRRSFRRDRPRYHSVELQPSQVSQICCRFAWLDCLRRQAKAFNRRNFCRTARQSLRGANCRLSPLR